MKKMIWVVGMVFMLSGIIGFAPAPVISATSDDPAEYENTESMMEEATDEYAEETIIEEDGEIPQEETMMEEDPNAPEETTEDMVEEPAMEETEEIQE